LHHWLTHPRALWLLSLFPVLSVLALVAARRRRRALLLFGIWPMRSRLMFGGWFRQALRRFLLFTGMTLLVVGIAAPRWGKEPGQIAAPARDLVVVLDLSRSMLADDVLGKSLPNRLGRAKDMLVDLADAAQRHGNYRLGLVVFAARARLVCPLTSDYDYFRDALAQADPSDPLLAPAANSVSGTRIGEGLRAAVAAQDPRAHGYQEIVLVSDGDDPADDGEWQAGALEAKKSAIPIDTVGIGDPQASSEIVIDDKPLLDPEGKPVTTRLEEELLQAIRKMTGGLYIPARTRSVALGDIFQQTIADSVPRATTDEPLAQYRQRYPLFFGAALFLLAAEMAIGDRRKRKPALATASAEDELVEKAA
jgi:Ca-activated chloride channel family protein